MRTHTIFCAIIAIICSVSAGPLHSASVRDCRYTIVKDHISSSSDEYSKIVMLLAIDERTFEEATRDLESGATIIIGDIPVSGDMMYGEFDQKRASKLTNYRYQYSMQKAQQYVETYLGQASIDALRLCLNALDPVGVNVFVTFVTEDYVGFGVEFNTSERDETKYEWRKPVTPIGGVLVDDSYFDESWTSTTRNDTLVVKREEKNNFVTVGVSVKDTPYSDMIFVPEPPTIQKRVAEGFVWKTKEGSAHADGEQKKPADKDLHHSRAGHRARSNKCIFLKLSTRRR